VSESANRGHLHSTTSCDLVAPRSRTTRYGRRRFAVSGLILWNSLALSVRGPSLIPTPFCALLKTVLFCRAYGTLTQHLCESLGCKDCYANTNSLAYLLTHLLVFSMKQVRVSYCTYGSVLGGMCGNVLDSPVHVLMRSQVPSKRRRLLTTHSQNAIICWQHHAVYQKNILVIVIRSSITNTCSALAY